MPALKYRIYALHEDGTRTYLTTIHPLVTSLINIDMIYELPEIKYEDHPKTVAIVVYPGEPVDEE